MSRSRPGFLAALGLILASPAFAAATLGQYDVDPTTVTVAGISSGGFMAVQMQVAYSSHFYGAAVFAGGPYYCAQDSESTATGACESGSGISLSALIQYTKQQASSGAIDAVSNLAGKPIWMFSGTNDTTVHPATMSALQQYYQAFTDAGSITFDDTTPAAHAWISPDGPNSCDTSMSPYINTCSIDPEQTFLTLFYGSLVAKTTGALGGSLVQFDQSPFCGSGGCSSISMDSTGWAFIPQSCAQGQACRLVLALHGCLQYQGVVGEDFVKESGLNEWADTNGIIVIYPQTTTLTSGNPEGCWDWWGYTGSSYAVQAGAQMQALMAMVNHVVAGSSGPVTTSSATGGSSGSSTGTAGSAATGTSGSTGSCGQLDATCTGNGDCCTPMTCQLGRCLLSATTGNATSGSGGSCQGLGLACTGATVCCPGSSCQFGSCLPVTDATATSTSAAGRSGSTGASSARGASAASGAGASGSSGSSRSTLGTGSASGPSSTATGTSTSSTSAGSSGIAGSGVTSASTGAVSAVASSMTGATSSSGASSAAGSTTGNGGLSLAAVIPNAGPSSQAVTVALEGAGMVAGVQALVGANVLTGLTLRSAAVLSATVPAGLPPGIYDVTVINPSGARAVLPSAYAVEATTSTSTTATQTTSTSTTGTSTSSTKKGGCASGDGAWGGLCALAALATRRRWLLRMG